MNRIRVIWIAWGVLLLAGFSSSAFGSCSSTLSGSTATVTCNAATDDIQVSQFDGGGGTYYWFHFGSGFGTDSADWNSGIAGQQVLAAGATTIVVNLAGGALTVGISGFRQANAIVGSVTLGGTSASQVTIDSTESSTASTYSVPDNDCGANVIVNSFTYNNCTSYAKTVTIITGTAADTVNVRSTFGGDIVNIDGNNGGDVVNITNAGSVQSIFGPVNVTNPSSFSGIAIDDHADSTARTATVTSSGITGLAPASISWVANDIANVVLSMGSGADTVNLQSFFSLSGGTLFVNGAGGADTVNIGNPTNGVQGIASPVWVYNPPSFTTLNIDDSADVTGRTATYTSTDVTGLAPGSITWTASDISSITLTNGSGADTVNILSTAKPLTVDGTNGFDTVTIGDVNGVQDILSTIYVHNPVGYTALNINDSPDTTARTATYTSTGVTGVAPVAITWSLFDINAVNLTMGSATDTVYVQSNGSWTTTIQGTAGGDLVDVTNSGSTLSVYGTVAIHNSSGYSTVVVDDSSDTVGRSAAFSATGISGLTAGNVTWVANDVSHVFAYFGSGDDTMHMTGSPTNGLAAIYSTINLGGGDNQAYVTGSGLGANTVNEIDAGSGDDLFVISAVPLNVTSLSIYGGPQVTQDELDYTGGPATTSGATTGFVYPADPNKHSIYYNSIEFFSIDDTIFRDGFQ